MSRGLKSIGSLIAVCVALGCLPAGAFALGEGRVYEMVSPLYKGGYGVLKIEAVAQNGESAMFYSPGVFAGAPSGPEAPDYISHRGPSGWSTTPLVVPASVMPYVPDRDVSRTLDTMMALGKSGASGGEEVADAGTNAQLMLHSTALPDIPSNWELAGMTLRAFPEEAIGIRYEDASPDFCHILVSPVPTALSNKTQIFLTEEAAEEEPQAVTQVYELNRGCGGEPVSLQVVGLNDKHKVMSPFCLVEVGINGSGTSVPGDSSRFNAVADGGKEIFFTTCIGGLSEVHQLFVRLDRAKTLEVSKPLAETCSEVPCPGAETRANADFVGASEDGSRVFFTTTAPLEPATDTDSGNDLYMATIGCPLGKPGCRVAEDEVTSLVQVSRVPAGGEAGVQGVVRLALDGSRVYFVARGDLLDSAEQGALEGEGRAVPRAGADNLYVYDSLSKQTEFVADLCSGKELSGIAEDTHCLNEEADPAKADPALWSEATGVEAQTAGPDGRFLVFATHAQLVPGDTDAAKDVYRYDAVTDELERVSLGEHGYDANGNNSRFDAAIAQGNWGERGIRYQYDLGSRAISEDGSRVVFTSAEPLSPGDTNGLTNVYEWHAGAGGAEGGVSMISGGSAEEPDQDAVISPEGNDVFFLTSQSLVPQDTDGGIPDLYDARVHGGFPPLPAPREPCSSDACQGPLTNPAPLLVPGSVSQAPESTAPAKTVVSAKKKPKAKKKAKRKKAKKHKGKRATRARQGTDAARRTRR
jgi:hypothetical protein